MMRNGISMCFRVMASALLAVGACGTNLYATGIGAHEGVRGTVVSVPIALPSCTNVASMHLKVNYDPVLLELQTVTNSPGSIGAEYESYSLIDDGTVDIVFASDEGVAFAAGDVTYLEFLVNPGAPVGMRSKVTVSRLDQGPVFGGESESRAFSNGCMWVVFSSASDTDSDGLSDYDEQMYNGLADYDPVNSDTDIGNPDTDGDNIPDGWEVAGDLNPLLDDASLDNDVDGFSNFAEWIAGTSPSDAGDRFAITNVVPVGGMGGVCLSWAGKAGRWYSVYSMSNLSDSIWVTNLARRASASDADMIYTSGVGKASSFYRLGVENE